MIRTQLAWPTLLLSYFWRTLDALTHAYRIARIHQEAQLSAYKELQGTERDLLVVRGTVRAIRKLESEARDWDLNLEISRQAAAESLRAAMLRIQQRQAEVSAS